jgi:predicted enzyme related to lactoylglutathione lyase
MEDFGISGLGGIFFKCNNPKETMVWYEQMLGLKTDGEYGATFEWRSLRNPSEKRSTAWSPFSQTSTYFNPSEKPFMLNFRVKDLNKLLEHLQENGVNQTGELQLTEYGKFAWIQDPDGIKIELWEADDDVFHAITEGKTHPT